MHTSRHSTCAVSNPHLSFAAGFGTLAFCQVAGFHRAVPSTTLDKAVCNFLIYYKDFFKIVNCFFLVFRIKCSQFLYGHFMTLLVEYDKYWI